MENNETMEVENVDTLEGEVVDNEDTGLGKAGYMLVGAAVTAASMAVVKAVKWAVGKIKAKKEIRKPDHEIEFTDDDIVDVAE